MAGCWLLVAGCWLLWCSWGLNQQLEERWIKSLKKNEHNKLLQRDPCIKNGGGGSYQVAKGINNTVNGGKGHRLSQNFPYYLGEGLCKDIFCLKFHAICTSSGDPNHMFRWRPWFVVGNFLSSSDDRSTCDFAHLILSAGRHHCLPRCCDCKEQEKKPSADSSVNEYGAQSCIEAISKHIQYIIYDSPWDAYLCIFKNMCVYNIEYRVYDTWIDHANMCESSGMTSSMWYVNYNLSRSNFVVYRLWQTLARFPLFIHVYSVSFWILTNSPKYASRFKPLNLLMTKTVVVILSVSGAAGLALT